MSQKFEVTSPGEWEWSCNWLRITWNQCTCTCEHIWFESTYQRPCSGKLKYCKGGLDPISCTNFRKIAHQVYFKQHSMHQKLKGKTSKISSYVQDLREILRFLQHERKTSWVYCFSGGIHASHWFINSQFKFIFQ